MVLKQLFFFKLQKIAQRLGATPPIHRQIQYVSQFRHFHILTVGLSPPPENEFLVTRQHQAKASDFPFYDIFAATKNFLSKFPMLSLHAISDLGPPQSKILATPMHRTHILRRSAGDGCLDDI